MVPYSTCDVEAWSVVQVIVAEVEVIAVEVTEVITGADSAGVAKVKFDEVARAPAEFADIAA